MQSLVILLPLLGRLRLAIITAKSSIIRIHLSMMGIAKATWLICSRLHRYHHCCKFESLLAQPGRHHDYDSLPLLPKALEILLMIIITGKSTTIRVYLSMGIARAQFLICSLHLAIITSLFIATFNHKRCTTIRAHLSMGTANAPSSPRAQEWSTRISSLRAFGFRSNSITSYGFRAMLQSW